MYMNSNSQRLNWGRRSEPHEALCSKREHDILEPMWDPIAKEVKRRQMQVSSRIFLPRVPLVCGIYHVLAKPSSSDEIMQNKHPPRGSVSFTNQTLEDVA